MGTNSSYRKKRYLSKTEIDMVFNKKPKLISLFIRCKNADGFITKNELKKITNGYLNDSILKKIIDICGSREHKLTYDDFLYFYALLNTTSISAKINFFLDFFFTKNDSITKEKYIHKVIKYFDNSGLLKQVLLSTDIIGKENENKTGLFSSNNKIEKDKLYNFIFKKYQNDFNNYDLYVEIDNSTTINNNNNNIHNNRQSNTKQSNNNNNIISSTNNNNNQNNINNNIKNNKNNTYTVERNNKEENANNKQQKELVSDNVLILKTNSMNKSYFSRSESKNSVSNVGGALSKSTTIVMGQNKNYDYLLKEFQNYEKINNGVFPISLFEDMLKELNVIESLVDIIGNYLRLKTQKSFFNFNLFKEILSIISIPTININDNDNEKNKEEIINGLFTLFAYPNEYINKKSFFLFMKSTNPELSSNKIKELFNRYNIVKYINRKNFAEMINYIINDLIESFEHMKYLPYIFFKADLDEKNIEKNCIDVLLKNRDINEYILERLQYDNSFYIIDKAFWDKWNLYVTKLKNNNSVFDNNNNASNTNILETGNNVNTNNINNNNYNNTTGSNKHLDKETNKDTFKDTNKDTNKDNTNNIKDNNNIENKSKDYSKDQSKTNKSRTNDNNYHRHDTKTNNLRMMTNKICDKNGKIKEGLVYLKDYIVLSPRLYNLFCKWYGPPIGMEIKREKIYLDDEEEDMIDKSTDSFLHIDKKAISRKRINKSRVYNNNSLNNNSLINNNNNKQNLSFFQSVDAKTNQKFEIEIFPIFLLFFNFVDMQSKNCTSLNQIVENIKQSVGSKNGLRYYPFSRKTKFSDLLKPLQNSINVVLNKKIARLWSYYEDKFEVVPFDETLEKYGIIDSAVIVLEINEYNYWPSEKLIKEPLNKIKKKNLLLVGLMNIGNTCYMNSILQIFLNIQQIKDTFIKEQSTEEESQFLNFLINKRKGKGELISEFINILKEKWVKNKKTITPKKFKEICGKYNETFRGYEQQDAHDFYTFLVDNLHEDTNIKLHNPKIINSETIDTNEFDLSNEHWANVVRNNASYIYGLFMGQLKSTLTCNKCNVSKYKYETFSALELPIPEEGTIAIEVILFRLPCTLSPFYKNENNNDNANNNNNNNNINDNDDVMTKNELTINIRKKLRIIKNTTIGKFADPSVTSPMDSERDLNLHSNKRIVYDDVNLNTDFYEKQKNIGENKNINNEQKAKDELISNVLNLNIPIKLRLEINRKKKCSDIINTLKEMKELELESVSKYTEFIMVSRNNYIKEDLIIDDTFLPFQQVLIYELLNYEGIKKIFGYNDLYENKAMPIDKQDVQNMIDLHDNEEEEEESNNLTYFSAGRSSTNHNILLSQTQKKKTKKKKKEEQNENNNENPPKKYFSLEEQPTCEILIPIFHGYRTNSNNDNEFSDSLFNNQIYASIPAFKDFVILSNKNAIKPINLYEMMWEKYMYFLDSPSKYEPLLWWKPYSTSKLNTVRTINQNNEASNNNINSFGGNHLPFILKIIKKSTRSCAFCPWFRFCPGCVLDPKNSNYLSLSVDSLILIEWTKDIANKVLKENNFLLILNHSTSNQLFESSETEEDKKSIYNCLDLFTHDEIMKNVFCEHCNERTNFTKKLEIDKLPYYLVAVLKRFKYTAMYTTKIDSLITFPLVDLDLKDYVTQKRDIDKYDLFGVVNHCGGLSGGHYHCNIKQDNIWIKYDDSYVCEENKKIETGNAYLLVYKCNNKDDNIIKQNDFQFDFKGLMDTAYKIYLKKNNFQHLFNYIFNERNEIVQKYLGDCEFYYGEPLTINGKSGFLINIYQKDDNIVFVKIKLNKGYLETKISKQKIIKETVKDLRNEITDIYLDTHQTNKENNKSNSKCGECIIF